MTSDWRARVLPLTAAVLQTIIAAFAIGLTIFAFNFAAGGIDAEKHRPSDQPSTGDIAFLFLFALIPVVAAILLWKRTRIGWWLSLTYDSLLLVIAIVSCVLTILSAEHLTGWPFGIALLFLINPILLTDPQSRQFFMSKTGQPKSLELLATKVGISS